MSVATWYTGDALTVLKTLPDASVDLVLTSPPFLALRSYLPAADPNKALEIGSEATPGEFLDVLLDVVEELRRVLAPHGSLVVELGDTYSGSGGAGGDYAEGGWREGEPTWTGANGAARRSRRDSDSDAATNAASDSGRTSCESWKGVDARNRGNTSRGTARRQRENRGAWPLAKSLCMIPSSFAFALAYGRNPWTGRTLEPWRVRNLIAWCRPNPPVGALGDKFRPGTSYLTVACTGPSRYFDLDAVSEPHAPRGGSLMTPSGERDRQGRGRKEVAAGTFHYEPDPAGAPPLDWWEIPTHPYPGAHYATFPPQLCVRPIKAMCPQKVCRVCGKPSERVTEPVEPTGYVRRSSVLVPGGEGGDFRANGGIGRRAEMANRSVETLGWSDCGHNDWRNGVVLDPFAGSGTTLEVATGHGRDAIGIDLDVRNLEFARQRIGMFLTEAEVVRGG